MFKRGFSMLALRYVAYLAIAIVFVKAWSMSRTNSRLLEENRSLISQQGEILAASARPILIRGFVMPLREFSTLVAEQKPRGPAPRQLVLIYRASCNACEQQLPHWEQMLQDPRLTNIETVLVSMGPDEAETGRLLHVLRGRALPYQVLQARAPAAFAVATGIPGVPVTIVADTGGSVELVEPGLADKRRLDLIFSALQQKSLSARVLLPFGLNDPL